GGTGNARCVKPVWGAEGAPGPALVPGRAARGIAVTVTASTAATGECATLSASIPAGNPTPINAALYGEAPLPEPRPDATRAHWTSLTTLGTPRAHYDEVAAETYVAKVSEALPLYRGAHGWVHPGFLRRHATRPVA